MRYQDKIYIQNQNRAVRNKDMTNVNMSSDICIFESPMFGVSGASKLNCNSGATGTSYVITTATTIPLTIDFTANTNTFTATSASFKYEIYKYNQQSNSFLIPPVYKSSVIPYSSFSATSATTQNVPISGLSLDGEYLIKGYYQFDVCTKFLNTLGQTIDTLTYRNGTKYGLYDNNLDYYFIATTVASTPKFQQNSSNTQSSNTLIQQTIMPTSGQTVITVSYSVNGYFVLTLNGLVLAPNYDYTYTGNVITLTSATVSDDIITIIYSTGGGNNLTGDNIYINSPVVSGATNGQGSNSAYFNTTTGKYEIYTNITPASGQQILVMINGVTLANNIDYYQSTSNPNRIILQGDILIGDIITIVYFPTTNVVNGLNTNTPTINWTISSPPQAVNGNFILQVSTASTFNTLYYSSATPYVIGSVSYNTTFTVSGNIGEVFYYRVVNQKNYETLCGDFVSSTATSGVIPLVIQSNAINSY